MTATLSKIEDAASEEFIDPKPPGMGPFGKAGSVGLFFALAMSGILMKLTTWWLGLLFALIVFPGLLMFCVKNPRTGRTKAADINRHLKWKAGERTGSNKYLSGPVSQIGQFLLPGFLAQSKLHQFIARDRGPVGLVEIPATNDYGIGIRCYPDGAALLAEETLLRFSDRWGRALKFLCNEPGAIQAAVTMSVTPDPGEAERDRILKSIKAGASDHARQVLTELANMIPPGAVNVDSWVTVAYDGNHNGKKLTPQKMAVELAPRLPTLLAKLAEGGAGHCVLMSPQDITDGVQAAYDPTAAKHIARMRELGLETGTRWDTIGPPRADNRWDCYRHGRAVSVTFTMIDIEGAVNLTTLEPLMRGSADIDDLRITIYFRLRSPEEKNRLAQRDYRNAQFHTFKPDHNAGDAKRQTDTTTTAKDTARGSGLVDISVVITATVLDREETVTDDNGDTSTVLVAAVDRVPSMVAAVQQQAPQAMLGIIRQDGGHGATFALGLGMGVPLVAWKHTKLSTALQEEM